MSNEAGAATRTPSCEDCRIPTTFRASIFDPRKNGKVQVYDCPTCKRMYWKE
jgi:uncharacterized protein with PIN domain